MLICYSKVIVLSATTGAQEAATAYSLKRKGRVAIKTQQQTTGYASPLGAHINCQRIIHSKGKKTRPRRTK